MIKCERQRSLFCILACGCLILCFSSIIAAAIAGTEQTPPSTSRSNQKTLELLGLSTEESQYDIPLSCGPACLAMVLHVLGRPSDNNSLIKMDPASHGTTFDQLSRFASDRGVYSLPVKMAPELLAKLPDGSAAVLQMEFQDAAIPDKDHFIVVFCPNQFVQQSGRTKNADVVFAFDPLGFHSYYRGIVPVADIAKNYTGSALVFSNSPLSPSEFASQSQFYCQMALAIVLGIALGFPVAKLAISKGPKLPRALAQVVVLMFIWLSGASVRGAIGPATASSGSTLLTVENGSRFDAGIIEKGQRISHEFMVRNASDHAVKLTVGETSCSCLAATIVGSPDLAPNQSTKVLLSAEFNAGGEKAAGANIETSKSDAPLFLIIGAAVANDVQLSTQRIDFGDLRWNGQVESRPLRVTYTGVENRLFTIESVSSGLKQLNITPPTMTKRPTTRPGVSETEYAVEVQVDPKSLGPGVFAGTIDLAGHNGAESVLFHVIAGGRVQPRVAVRPNSIALVDTPVSVNENRGPEQISLRIRTEGDDPAPQVAKLTGDGVDILEWTEKLDGSARLSTISAKLRPAPEATKRNVIIELKSPPNIRLEVPVYLIRSDVLDQK